MADKYEFDRFTGKCPTCGQEFYKEVFETAKAFIDSHVADPDINKEMVKKHNDYQVALNKFKDQQK